MEARALTAASVLLAVHLCSAALLLSARDVDPTPSSSSLLQAVEEERQYELERRLARQRVTAGRRSYSRSGLLRPRSRSSEAIESATLNSKRDLSCVVEGDIRVCEERRDTTGDRRAGETKPSLSNARPKRQVVSAPFYSTWPNGTVPYAIDRDSYGTAAEKAVSVIRKALDAWESKTNIRFVEITPPESTADEVDDSGDGSLDYLLMHHGSGCWSFVGRTGGRQEISLAKDGCLYTGVVMHEIAHALGLIHEQSRPDRDRYVLVLPHNIARGATYNFLKVPEPTVRRCTRYNVESIMHYSPSSFGLGNRPTLVARAVDFVALEGNRAVATHYDYAAVCCLYSCQGDCTNECENDGYSIKDAHTGACQCVCPYGLGGLTCSEVDRTEFSCGSVIVLDTDSARPYRLDAASNRNGIGGKCAWLFKAPAGRVVRITFNSFNVASQSGVCQHFVEVRQNLLGQTGTAQYCGSGAPSDIYSRGFFEINAALLIFDYSATSAAASSFSANVTAYVDGCMGDPCRGVPCLAVAQPTGHKCVPRSDNFICGFENMASDNCSAILLGSGAEGFTAAAAAPADTAQRPWEVTDAEYESVPSTQGSFFASARAQVPGTSRGVLRIVPFDFRSEPRCLKFQYFLESENAGVLNVYRAVNGSLGAPIFSRRATAALQRYQKQQPDTIGQWQSSPPIEIKPPKSPVDLVEIVFEAYHSGEDLSRSMIALDDVRYMAGKCPRGACAIDPCGTAKCSEGAATDEGMITGIDEYTCLTPDDPDYDASCSFEEWQDCSALVNLEKMPGDSIAWRPSKYPGIGFKWPYSTGPSGAAVGQSYLYLPLYNQPIKSRARMRLLPRKATAEGWCLAFRFCMNGLNVGALNVHLVRGNNDSTARLLWTARGHQGAQWLQAAVSVTTKDVTADARVEVIIEGVGGDLPNTVPWYYASDLAIDDVSLLKGTCDRFQGRFVSSALVVPTTTTTRTTTTTTARSCRSGWSWNGATRSWVWTCS